MEIPLTWIFELNVSIVGAYAILCLQNIHANCWWNSFDNKNPPEVDQTLHSLW